MGRSSHQHKTYQGLRYGRLVVIRNSGKNSDGRDIWEVVCDCGSTKVVIGKNLRMGVTTSCGCAQREAASRIGKVSIKKAIEAAVGVCTKSVVSYRSAHARVYRAKGSASRQMCLDCGEQARHWSYTHNDPDAIVSTEGVWKGVVYSLNPDFYVPRCVKCHKDFDTQH